MKSVVITGMGVCTAAGASLEELWQNVLAGHSPAAWRVMADRSRIAVCAVRELPPRPPGAPHLRHVDRSVRLAQTAAAHAWQDAGLDVGAPDPERFGILCGTSRGPHESFAQSMSELASGRMYPRFAPNTTIASLSGALSATFGAQGPCMTVSATCASGAAAIALGAQQILLGTADVVLAGGAEAPLTDVILAQLQSARVLGSSDDPQRTCRPFDRSRNGTVLGEGAAFLVLESLDSAQARGARVLARLAGWAVGSESGERTGAAENGGGLCRVMRQSLALAALPASAIGYINLHGTGTVLNDRIEPRAVERLLGSHLASVPCSSTKPVTGHCMGAAAAIEAVITILALRSGSLPPTINCVEKDPECRLDLITRAPRARSIDAALSTSSGFWGVNAALVFTAS